MQYADLHSDTLTVKKYLKGAERELNFWERENGHISLQKLIKGECAAQVFALFSRSIEENAWETTLEFVKEFKKGERVFLEAGITPIFAIEDGGNVENDLKRVEYLLNAGVKIFGITWNDENCLGYPCGKDGGLKKFGFETLEFLMERGVYPDISHLSDEGIFDVLKVTGGRFPVIATHSLSRTVCPHKRNLTDEQIIGVANSGGIIGVNFEPSFIGEQGLYRHIEHIVKIGGEEVIAIGTDFDGILSPVYAGADKMQEFFEDMKKGGLTTRLLEKLFYKNAKRLLDF